MKKTLFLLIVYFIALYVSGQSNQVTISNDATGMRLKVDGRDFIVNGINWDYVPIGNGILDKGIWNQSDEVIKAALDAEMSLFKNMGVNAIRTYGLEPQWITYIYENYGIYTMLNTQFGAYGLTINGAWRPNTDYSDPATLEVLMKEVRDMAQRYKNTPGLLLYMVGNENNYHLSWTGAETEDIPIDGVDPGIRKAAEALYTAFNEGTKAIKAIDTSHPVAICNGDLLYLDIVKQKCTDIDIYGTNMYRGISFSDAFQRVKDELNLPILFAEFGADAFNAMENKEDQYSQAYYMVGNWKEIYENAAGVGKTGISLGGFTFQSSDGWWKYKQTEDFDVHNTTATWANGGYARDLAPGGNNMNEEWFGICAKGETNSRGLYQLYPRAAYYALKEAHMLNPYVGEVNLNTVNSHFANISLMDAVIKARGDKASLVGEKSSKIRVSNIRAEFSTFITGGDKITTERPDINNQLVPNKLGFDRMESYFVGIEAKPEANVQANVTFNILGNVAQNPINELFYEAPGRTVEVDVNNNTQTVLTNPNPIRVYQANYSWDSKYFKLKGFYRTGHYHWGYEGDFFGLYPEANYGPNIDIYGGFAPNGFEIEGKKRLNGLKVAFGPELWWGANPAILMKYTKNILGFEMTGIYHEDLEEPGAAVSSIAVPMPKTRRASVYATKDYGNLSVEVGGIWGGDPLVGRGFEVVRNDTAYQDFVRASDTWGGKVKLSYAGGRFNWYGQASSRGVVANAGGDYTQTFTGWRLKDFGSGNVNNVFSGFTYTVGKLQIAPNGMWQKPLVDPIPLDGPTRLRNIIADPFVVRSNRETIAGELLLTFDPTPGTWMYDWANDRNEDAELAVSLGLVYWHLPTSMDAAIIFPGDGRTPSPAAGAAPAQDLWEVNARIVSKLSKNFGMIINAYGGTGQANGGTLNASDDVNRTIERYGVNFRAIYKDLKLNSHVKVNDWGPFDYYRDFNLTFPLQVMADLSTSISKPDWFALPSTQLGIRFTWRSLDQYSPRYAPTYAINNLGILAPDPTAPGFGNGSEWELRTYLHINIGK